MREYARQQTAILLQRLAVRLRDAARQPDETAIHDMRVAIRRLRCCLRVFAPLYADRSWKKIRRQLAALMTAAGAVRDCDIALELMKQAGISSRSALVASLKAERRKNEQELRDEIAHWSHRGSLKRWRVGLEG